MGEQESEQTEQLGLFLQQESHDVARADGW